MNNFKKLYNNTFNDIHAPDSIKQEVIRMSKKLDSNKLKQSNNIVETSQVEVSNGFNYSKIIAFATCIALVGAGAFGLNYLKNSNHDIDVAISNTGSETSTSIDTSISVTNTSLIDNSNFEDIFGVKLQDLNPQEIFADKGGNPKFLICNGDSSVIMDIISNLNTSTWIESIDVIPNNDDVSSQLVLSINGSQDVYDNQFYMTFYALKNGNDDIYVRVINESKNIDSCYKVNYDILNNISNAFEKNNYLYFNINPSNSLSVSFDANNTTITDKSVIKSISESLFDNFTWTFDDEASAIFHDESLNYDYDKINFSQSYEDANYSINIFKYDNSLYARVNVHTANNTYGSIAKLTSNNLEEDYQKLVDLIKGNNNINTSSAVTEVTTAPITDVSTENVTTVIPVITVSTVSTTPPITTINTTTSELETITTQTTEISFDIQPSNPYYAIPANMKPDGSSPLFLDWEVRSFFFSAYSIADILNKGVSFTYSLDEFTTINEKIYYKVPFDTLNELEDYLRCYFTDSYIQNNNLMDIYFQLDDGVYFEENIKPANNNYIGHTFYLDSVTNDRIVFHANAYYQNSDNVLSSEMYTGSNFYGEEPTIPYSTQVCNYVLVKTQNGWKFDTLDLMN